MMQLAALVLGDSRAEGFCGHLAENADPSLTSESIRQIPAEGYSTKELARTLRTCHDHRRARTQTLPQADRGKEDGQPNAMWGAQAALELRKRHQRKAGAVQTPAEEQENSAAALPSQSCPGHGFMLCSIRRG